MVTSFVTIVTCDENLYPRDKISNWLQTYPAISFAGNQSLINLPLTALFCSRKCPGEAILKAYDLARELREKETPVISGFHTPVEKDMLEILLKGKGPIVMCPARGLEGMQITEKFRGKFEKGQLLFCSVADPQEKRVTADSSDIRNNLVAALATDNKFVYIEPGGKLEILHIRVSQIAKSSIEIDEV